MQAHVQTLATRQGSYCSRQPACNRCPHRGNRRPVCLTGRTRGAPAYCIRVSANGYYSKASYRANSTGCQHYKLYTCDVYIDPKLGRSSFNKNDTRKVSFNLACVVHKNEQTTGTEITKSFSATVLYPFQLNFALQFQKIVNELRKNSQCEANALQKAGVAS